MNTITKYLYDGFIKVFKRNNFDVVQTRDSVAGLVFHLEKQKFIFVVQYRPGSDQEMIEIPAGGINENEAKATAIHREILEETGYKTHKLDTRQLKIPFYVSPGYATEQMTLFYCLVRGERNMSKLDGEISDLIELDRDQVIAYYNSGRIIDMKTIFALSAIGII